MNKRKLGTLTVTFLICVYFFLPWPHKIGFSAVVVPIKEQILWVPIGGTVKKINVKRGQDVVKNQEIAVIQSVSLEKEMLQAAVEKEAADRKILQLSLNDDTTQYLSQMQGEKALAGEKSAKLESKNRVMTLIAEISGKLYDWNPDLKVDQNVSEGTVLGKIADFSHYAVKAFVSENQISYFTVGQDVTVQIEHPLIFTRGKVLSIAPYSSTDLIYPALASTNFGPLPVVEKAQGRLGLVESYYVVFVDIEDADKALSDVIRMGQTAQVIIRGPWISNAAELFRKVTQVLIRESSL